LKKIKAHGIRGPLLHWIGEWLKGRRQRVVLNGKFSGWEAVLSGVPQGSVLGPLLFIIYINDIDEATKGADIVKKFADDTKLGKVVETLHHKEELQSTLDSLMEWSDTWGMRFNIEKCKVLHMGAKNPKFKYTMEGKELCETTEEKDIGILVTDKLKPAAQCVAAARTAQAVLSQISRAFHYRDRHIFVQLYKQYVRPHLEFSTQVWSPWNEEDKACLEKIQQRAVKMVSGLRAVTYVERLRELGLTTLEERRHQADMAMVHKILHGQGGLNPETWFERADNARNTRSAADPFNIKKKNGRLEVRRNFFAIRVIEQWNAIPAEMKKLNSAAKFRAQYKKLRATMHSA
jgi:ribonucleases P/MRP protein subunit RPP40